jgi:predicted nucleic acid-binding protein
MILLVNKANVMRQIIYIETSIPSFYYEDRNHATAIARREWTRKWWDYNREVHDLVSSTAVIDELEDGVYAKKENCLSLLKDIPLLAVESEVSEITATYLKHKLMPNELTGDALHLALASYYKCDFLLTWNCKHLANANKFRHIRQINTLLGLFVPNLVTPLELLGEQSDE